MLRDDIFKVDVERENIREEDPFTLAVVFIEMGLIEFAWEELKKAKKEAKEPAKARELLGLLYLETGEPEKAIKEFRDAIDMVDDFSAMAARLYYNLASVYEKTGDPEEALKTYEAGYIRDIYYKDIEEKITQLRQQRRK